MGIETLKVLHTSFNKGFSLKFEWHAFLGLWDSFEYAPLPTKWTVVTLHGRNKRLQLYAVQ